MAFGEKATGRAFIRTEDGTEVVLLGDEETGNVSYNEDKKRYYADKEGGFRFAVNAWDGEKVGILEGGWRLYCALGDACKEHGQACMFRIGRSGSGVDTEYDAEPTRSIPADELAELEALPKQNLRELSWLKQSSDDDIPF